MTQEEYLVPKLEQALASVLERAMVPVQEALGRIETRVGWLHVCTHARAHSGCFASRQRQMTLCGCLAGRHAFCNEAMHMHTIIQCTHVLASPKAQGHLPLIPFPFPFAGRCL